MQLKSSFFGGTNINIVVVVVVVVVETVLEWNHLDECVAESDSVEDFHQSNLSLQLG